MKIKDRLVLGVVAGLISGLPGLIVNNLEHSKRLNDMTYPQIAGALLLKQKKVNTIHGQIMGNLVNGLGLSIVGIAITYILSATGRDYAVAKRVGVSSIFGVYFRVLLPDWD